jgi:hypothetical protein
VPRPLLKRGRDGRLYAVPGSLPRTTRSVDPEPAAQPVSDVTGPQQPTSPRARRRGRARLEDDDVRSIRAEHATGKWTLDDLGYIYGVSPAVVGNVVRGISYTHVKPLPDEQD